MGGHISEASLVALDQQPERPVLQTEFGLHARPFLSSPRIFLAAVLN